MGLLSTIGAASGRAFGLTRVGAAIRDTYFNLVTLLLPGNGTNGAQNNTFLDSSTNNFTITRNGNTTQGTFSPFSQTGWSNFFDGSGDYLSAAANTNLNLGSGDFTVECWVYPTVAPSGARSFLSQASVNATNNGFALGFNGTSNNIWWYSNGAAVINSSSGLQLNSWNHVAAVRSGTTLTLYINGVSVGTATNSTNYGGSSLFYVGIDEFNQAFTGYISNLRILKGTAQYTSAFTPPTAPLTAITNTSLLTCQSNRFIDNSTNAFAITKNGDASVQAFSPFAPTAAYSAATVGGSGFFDGTGDYLTTPSNAAFDFWGGSFTFECWFYPTGGLSNSVIFSTGSSTTGVNLGFSSNTQVYSNQSGGLTLISGTAPTLNAWNHIALSKSGSTFALFLNGARLGTSTSTAYPTGNQVAYIGANSANNSQVITGYVSNARLVKGSAVYDPTQTTLTVPTAPLTAITNTSLLLNYTNAGITDATAKNVLETVGNAQISTTQSKFGGSSMYFDGTGDYLQVGPSQLLNLGASDFTIEFWIYPTSFASATYPMYSTTARAKADVLAFEVNTGGVITAYLTAAGGGAWSIASAGNVGTLTLNTWNHVALVRNGTAFRGYVNGVQGGMTNNSSSAVASFDGFSIGAFVASGFFTGYMDDIRITRFARYTGNFTPPAAAFALQ